LPKRCPARSAGRFLRGGSVAMWNLDRSPPPVSRSPIPRPAPSAFLQTTGKGKADTLPLSSAVSPLRGGTVPAIVRFRCLLPSPLLLTEVPCREFSEAVETDPVKQPLAARARLFRG